MKRGFSAEREILKLMFAFDYINYARYNTYQHVCLNNLLRKDKSIAKDLISNETRSVPSTEIWWLNISIKKRKGLTFIVLIFMQ